MSWDKLSMKDRAKYIRMGVSSGISDLDIIRDTYNSFAEGGDTSAGGMVNAIYQAAKEEEFLGEPEHRYDFTQSEEWANKHGYYPDERGHRDDAVKKPAHPTHPSRGKWNGLNEFQLTDRGMKDPNYIMFGMADGGQDPQATLTYNGAIVLPEFTVTPKGNYIHNSYDNINIKFAKGGLLNKFKDGGSKSRKRNYNTKVPEYGKGNYQLSIRDHYSGELLEIRYFETKEERDAYKNNNTDRFLFSTDPLEDVDVIGAASDWFKRGAWLADQINNEARSKEYYDYIREFKQILQEHPTSSLAELLNKPLPTIVPPALYDKINPDVYDPNPVLIRDGNTVTIGNNPRIGTIAENAGDTGRTSIGTEGFGGGHGAGTGTGYGTVIGDPRTAVPIGIPLDNDLTPYSLEYPDLSFYQYNSYQPSIQKMPNTYIDFNFPIRKYDYDPIKVKLPEQQTQLEPIPQLVEMGGLSLLQAMAPEKSLLNPNQYMGQLTNNGNIFKEITRDSGVLDSQWQSSNPSIAALSNIIFDTSEEADMHKRMQKQAKIPW